MKKIFTGSSKEGLEEIIQVAAVLPSHFAGVTYGHYPFIDYSTGGGIDG